MQPQLDGTDPFGHASVVVAHIHQSTERWLKCGKSLSVWTHMKRAPGVQNSFIHLAYKSALVKALKSKSSLSNCAAVVFRGFLPFSFNARQSLFQ